MLGAEICGNCFGRRKGSVKREKIRKKPGKRPGKWNFYDSMLGKLIVHANTREDAIRKMEAALCEMVIVGVETNVEDQLKLVRSEAFHQGEYDTLILPEILNRRG